MWSEMNTSVGKKPVSNDISIEAHAVETYPYIKSCPIAC